MSNVKSLEELKTVAKPLMDYIKGLKNPHIKAIVNDDSVEVFEGIAMTFNNKKEEKE